MDNMRLNMAIADKHRYIEAALKKYGLLEQDSSKFDNLHLNMSHLDIDMPEGSTYYDRVNTWFDFVTTLHIEAGLEPLFMYNGSIPNVRTLVIMLKGVNREACPTCNGSGRVLAKDAVVQTELCPDCLGLGVS